MDMDNFMREIKPRQNPYKVSGFSFGSRTDDAEGAEQVVGPGSYVVTSPLSKIGAKFGNSERFEQSPKTKFDIPGPGSYSFDPSPTLMKAKKDLSSSPKGKAGKTSGTFSRTERISIFSKAEASLGPGQYSLKRDFEDPYKANTKSQEFKIHNDNSIASKTLKAFVINDNPGPGQYDPVVNLTSGHNNQPGYTVGYANRDFMNLSQSLKQGLPENIFRYNLPETMGKSSPKIGFGKGQRSDLVTMKDGPRPTDYFKDVPDPYSKVRGGVFPNASRKIIAKDQALGPGPGEYDVYVNGFTKGYKISEALTHSKKKSEPSSPGPGYYDVLAEFDEKRRDVDKKLSAYQANSPKDNSNTDPSMTLHSFGDKSPKKSAPSKVMWVEDVIRKSISPGPMYMITKDHIDTQIGNIGTRFSMVPRREFIADEMKKDIPGPGAYVDPNEDNKEKWTSFAVSKRKENPILPEYTLEIPGPGAYENDKQNSTKGRSFSKAVKNLDRSGQYSESPTRLGKKKNKYSRSRSPMRNL